MNMKTVWSVFKETLQSTPMGEVVTRQQLLNRVEKEIKDQRDDSLEKIRCNQFNHFSPATVDYFRNMSEKLGYLEKTERRGEYVVRKRFPEKTTSVSLRRDYNLEMLLISLQQYKNSYQPT